MTLSGDCIFDLTFFIVFEGIKKKKMFKVILKNLKWWKQVWKKNFLKMMFTN